MSRNQATLGKFLGNPNQIRAPAQQTKLAFSSMAGSTDKETKPGKENGVSVKSDDTDVRDDTAVDGAAIAVSPSRKRIKEESDEDDEPPNKRSRSKRPSEKSRASPQSECLTRRVDTRREVKPQSRSATGSQLSAKKPASTDAESGNKEALTDDDPEQSLEEDENDVEDDDEVEQDPKAAAKHREKIQSTLTSHTKDAYPDWKAGDPVPFAALCTTFSKIEMTTKRLEIQSHSSLFFRQVMRLTPEDLLPVILMFVNKLAADYAGIELGIGESLIMKAISESTGKAIQFVKADQKEIGDLGLVAAKSRSNQSTMFKPKPLTVRAVHDGLMAIATTEGQGAQGRKVGGIKKLLSAADAHMVGKGKGIDISKDKGGPSECKYIIRALEGKMRLGLAEKTVLVSLAHAMVMHETVDSNKKAATPEQLARGETILKNVYNELPSYEVVVPALLKGGIFKLGDVVKLQAGVPLKPMLAKPTKSISEVLDRFEGHDFTCEFKYDGERAQIHFVAHDSDEQYATSAPSAGKNAKGIANIFSRNSEDLSKKYPDILAKLPTWVKDTTKSFVLDCETVAWDVEKKHVLPFQQLMTRKRKDVKVEDVKVKVCVFAFDLLYLNGEALVKTPFRDRREKLHGAFNEVEGEFSFAKFGDTNVIEEIQNLLEDSVKASCEGLMVKMLDGVESHYEPSRRSQNWLKVKKDYLSGTGDSLDLAVLGAYYGRGKRTSWYGAFLLACWNPSTENFETVCNIGTGFSEAILEEFHKTLSPLVIDRPKPFYTHSSGNKDQPDVWFEPKYVWEVKTADLTVSPRYRAAADEFSGGKGISLRFPRFLKIRDDKKPEQATTSKAVAEMYRKQENVSKGKGPSVDDDFEY